MNNKAVFKNIVTLKQCYVKSALFFASKENLRLLLLLFLLLFGGEKEKVLRQYSLRGQKATSVLLKLIPRH